MFFKPWRYSDSRADDVIASNVEKIKFSVTGREITANMAQIKYLFKPKFTLRLNMHMTLM
jgi:hypothetical protein